MHASINVERARKHNGPQSVTTACFATTARYELANCESAYRGIEHVPGSRSARRE